jgi:hypothetical protein
MPRAANQDALSWHSCCAKAHKGAHTANNILRAFIAPRIAFADSIYGTSALRIADSSKQIFLEKML